MRCGKRITSHFCKLLEIIEVRSLSLDSRMSSRGDLRRSDPLINMRLPRFARNDSEI